MGLDMYLTASKYFYDEDAPEPTAIAEMMKTKRRVKSVSFEAMYWRKANWIHGWFVENVQRGEDDCKSYELDREKLEKLVATCRIALERKDPDLLPPVGGFFFGGTEEDDWYWESIQKTADELTKVLEDFPNPYYFSYQSSW
jgi:hypothetical protein